MAEAPEIYILDDDASVRDSLAALLHTYGYEVTSFARADAFFAALGPTTHGCLILDMQLPDVDGLEVLARLHANGPRLQVIVVTAFGDIPLAVAAMKAGAVDFLEKPFDDGLLVAAVRAALDADGQMLIAEVTAHQVASRLATLTERENDVLKCLVSGKQNKQIAFDLGISPRTVEIHRSRVMRKMSVSSLSQLVRIMVTVDTGTRHSR